MRDFAWSSVKLFLPATGAPGLCSVLTAGVVCDVDGVSLWAKTAVADSKRPTESVAICFIGDLLLLQRQNKEKCNLFQRLVINRHHCVWAAARRQGLVVRWRQTGTFT